MNSINTAFSIIYLTREIFIFCEIDIITAKKKAAKLLLVCIIYQSLALLRFSIM